MRTFYLQDKGINVTIPTKQDIDNLKIGDHAPNCFGYDGIVKSITYRGIDINGKSYIGYYVSWHSADSSISMSLKENEIVYTVKLSSLFTSNELMDLNAVLIK